VSPFLRYQFKFSATEHPYSDFLLWILARMLVRGYCVEPVSKMACMVRVIYMNIKVVINQHCRALILLVECAPNPASACCHLLNEPWLQVFSCFLQLTSCFHIAIKWIGRELLHLLYTLAEILKHLPLRITVLARDSIAYFVIICGLCILLSRNHSYLRKVQHALCMV
jgi:hypothetical protein